MKNVTGFSLCLFPRSWAMGVKEIGDKTLLAIGPFRLGIHRTKKSWKDY